MIPPPHPPQSGHPTTTGTAVVCPLAFVVIQVFLVHAVFVTLSIEARGGILVCVHVIPADTDILPEETDATGIVV